MHFLAVSLILLVSPCWAAGGQEEEWEALTRECLLLYQKGKYPEAIAIGKQALEKSEMAFGRNHLYTAGSRYNLATGLQPDAQRIPLEAIVEGGIGEVSLWVDGELVAQLTTPPFRAWWPITVGDHQAWGEVILDDGSRVMSEVVFFRVEE